MHNKHACYFFLILILGTAFFGCCPTPDDLPFFIEKDRAALVAATQDLVRVPSVQGEAADGAPAGDEVAQALDAALALCEGMGFKTINLDGYIGYTEYGTGADYVAVLGHLDVVSAGNPDDWTYPPFSGDIHDNAIWGRGTQDDKGPILAALYGLKAIKDAGLPLSKRVRVIFGTMEEETGPDVSYYRSKEELPIQGFTPDAYFPVVNAEKGLIRFDLSGTIGPQTGDLAITSITGGSAINAVPAEAVAVVHASDANAIAAACANFAQATEYELSAAVDGNTVTITSHGLSVHSMRPESGKNAIMQLLAFLGSLDLPPSDLSAVLDFMNTYFGMETNGDSMFGQVYTTDAGTLSMSVDLVTVNETSAKFSVDLRFPGGIDGDTQIRQPLLARLDETGVGLAYEEWEGASTPLYFDPATPFIQTLMGIYQQFTGDITTQPLSIGGKSYAQELPNMVAYGALFPDEAELFHQVDEHVDIEDLILSAKIYARAIYELAK
ncbi:MAG TPA: dipeptidase PepV [Candidatus Hydrogenedentes bacterium]|nr:dipeptidase PepV [Candidatus Hydrogenedentota bacterium]